MSGLIARRADVASIVSAGPFVGALDAATVGADDGDAEGDALCDAVGPALGLVDGDCDGSDDDVDVGPVEGAADVVGEPEGCELGAGETLATAVGPEEGAGPTGAGEPPPPEHALSAALTMNASPVVDRRETKYHPRDANVALRY